MIPFSSTLSPFRLGDAKWIPNERTVETHEMNTADQFKNRQKLTAEELIAIADRLESLAPSIAEGYEYPVADLIANLRDFSKERENYVERDENGEPVVYYLFFSSPPSTWQSLCGRQGIYTVDAKSLESRNFQLTCMN
jgi:hypothetical protein